MVRIITLITVYPHHEPTPQTESSFKVCIYIPCGNWPCHTLTQFMQSTKQSCRDSMHDNLHEVCGSRLAV